MFRKFFFTALMALCIGGISIAAEPSEPPTLDIPDLQAIPGKYLVISPKTTAKSVTYVEIDNVELVPTNELKDPKKLIMYIPRDVKEGTKYRLAAVGTLNDVQVKVYFSVYIGAAPPIPPGPGPGPNPNPNPVPTKLWGVVIIEETGDNVADRGKWFTDPTLSKLMKDKGYRFRVVDKDVVDEKGNPPADVKRFMDLAKGKKYPQYFLLDADGGVVVTGDLPKTVNELADLFTKWGK